MPHVVLVDLDDWRSFATMGAALRRRGVRVSRVARRRGGLRGSLRHLLDRVVLGEWPVLLGAGEATDPSRVLSEVLSASPDDVHASEEFMAAAFSAPGPTASDLVGRVPNEELRTILYDKLLMTRHAEDLGLSVPLTWSAPPEGRFPVMVKGRSGAGGLSVRVATDPATLDAAIEELAHGGWDEVFFQEVCPGRLINVGGVARDGEVIVSVSYAATPRADDPLGPPEWLEVVDVPRLCDELGQLVASLRYTGVFCVDYMVDDGDHDGSARLAMIDVNSRAFGAWLALQLAGADILGAYLSILGVEGEPAGTTIAAGTAVDCRMLPRLGQSDLSSVAREGRRAGRAIAESLDAVGARRVAVMAVQASILVGAEAGRVVVSRLASAVAPTGGSRR